MRQSKPTFLLLLLILCTYGNLFAKVANNYTESYTALMADSGVISITGSITFNVTKNASVPVKSYKLTGSNLSANIVVSFPQGRIQLSRFPDSAFTNQLTILPISGRVDSVPIYVKLSNTNDLPDSSAIYITHTSSMTASKALLVKIFYSSNEPAKTINISTPQGPLETSATKGVTTNAMLYKVSADGLTENLQIAAPNRFTISRYPDSAFSQQLLIAPLNGKIDSVPIYVKFRSDSVIANVLDSITHTSVGAVTTYARVKVTMIAGTPPVIRLITNGAALEFNVQLGKTSAPKSYYVSGEHLLSNITISTLPGKRVEISRYQDSAFSNNLSIAPVNGRIDSARIFVRVFNDSLIGNYSHNIAHTSTGATTQDFLIRTIVSNDSMASKPEVFVNGSIKFNINQGTPVAIQSYKVAAIGINEGKLNISVVNTNKVQLSRIADGAYSSQLILDPINGKVDSTTIYVKLLDANDPPVSNAAYITHIASTATIKNIPVEIIFAIDSVAGIKVHTPNGPIQILASKGVQAPASSYIVNGTELTGNVLIKAPNHFQISRYLDSAYSQQLSLTPVNGKLDSTRIYVTFRNDSAYTVITDSISHTSAGTASRYLTVKATMPKDSSSSSPTTTPSIVLHPANGKLSFIAKKGVTTAVQSYKISAANIPYNTIHITAPNNYQVSLQQDTDFSQMIALLLPNQTIDSANIYVRFRSDSAIRPRTDSILHATVNGTTIIKMAVAVSDCDSVFNIRPLINQVATDGSILCFKDSLILSVTPSTGSISHYKWSNGETTPTIKVTSSTQVSVQVTSTNGCVSTASPVVRLVKNTNTKPSIGITSDSVLVSTTAPYYRWYINNNRSVKDSSGTLIAKKAGFYRVETSNDRLCWDASDNVPIINLSSTTIDSIQIRAFPNPVPSGSFTVVGTLDKVTNVVARVTVTNSSGTILVQTNKFIFFGREIKIPVNITSGYKGTAFIRLEINDKVQTQTLIIQ